MADFFKDVLVLRQGDRHGNRMILRLTAPQGEPLYAIAVPREGYSHTGPTWAYLFENEGLTMIDSGVMDSFSELEDGIRYVGYQPRDLERVIITHGHEDHDGAVAQLIDEAGAELWAHDIYSHLLPYAPREIQGRPISPIQLERERVVDANAARPTPDPSRLQYLAKRKGLEVKHRIRAGETAGKLTFLSTPGHSPDELCITLDGAVFTGDHVLPEITPHPTSKTEYTDEVKHSLPAEYHDEDRFYGLETYLRSLKLVTELGPAVSVLPAHRLYNRAKFNFETTARAQATINHHAERLAHMLDDIGPDPMGLEDLTRRTFDHRKLDGGNLYAALSEVVAHLELLEDAGDVEITEEPTIRTTGSKDFGQLLRELAP